MSVYDVITFLKKRGLGLVKLKLADVTTATYNLIVKSDSDTTVLTADRTLTIDVNNANRVLDLQGDLTVSAAGTLMSVDPAITATGVDDTDGYALTKQYNVITGGAANTGVELPLAVVGLQVTIANLTASAKKVYANASDAIDDKTATTGFVLLQPEQIATFRAHTTALWQSDFEANASYQQLQTDTISEFTSGSGVTIDGVLLKDSGATFGAGNVYYGLTSQTALAGGAQAGTALSAEYMNFTVVATALDSAQLPTPVLGTRRIVRNSSTKPMAVFGQTGASIDDGAANASIVIAPNTTVVFDAISATAWKSSIGTTKVSDIITEEITFTATEIVGTSAGDLGHASGGVLVAGVSSAYAMEFVSAVAIYDFDTAAYTGGGNDTTINIGGGGAALTGVVTSANLLGAAGDKVVVFKQLSTAALPLSVGTGLSLNSVTAWTQPGTAAGVLRVQVSYRLHKTGL